MRNVFADALCGLITAEEAQDITEEKDVTPAKTERPQLAREVWPDDAFNKQKEKFLPLIESGSRKPEDIISSLESRYSLTEEQKETINNIKIRR